MAPNFQSPININLDVPKSASGRLIDALTDAIRPFTERRGLKADMIRLQREEVALDIALRAKRRLELLGGPERVPSTKFLVNFFEKASTEESEGLADWWANLLARSCTSEEADLPIFADLLGKLDPVTAQYFYKFMVAPRESAAPYDSDVPLDFNPSGLPPGRAADYKAASPREMAELVHAQFDVPGVMIENLDLTIFGGNEQEGWEIDGSRKWSSDVYVPMAILVSMNLVRQEKLSFKLKEYEIFVSYWYATEFGGMFWNAVNGFSSE